MNQSPKSPDYLGIILISSLFLSLLYAGFLSYKSIDSNVLKRLESQPLLLPTPAAGSTTIQVPLASPSATQTPQN